MILTVLSVVFLAVGGYNAVAAEDVTVVNTSTEYDYTWITTQEDDNCDFDASYLAAED